MIKNNSVKLLSALLILTLLSCAPQIPKKEYPLEIEKEYNTSFDRAWDSVQEVISTYNGKILHKDKDSGLILYQIKDEGMNLQFFNNLYIEKLANNSVKIYFFPYKSDGRSLIGIDKDLFDRLNKSLM